MPPTRSRAGGFAAATALVLSGAMALPALAADSPEAAVNELVDAVTSGDYAAIDTLVCEAEREAVRAQLDPSEAMGLGGDDFPISFRIEDRNVELVSEDGDTATLALTGTMSMDVATDDIEAIAMQMLEADMGEMSDEDVEAMLPFITMALSQTSPLDEEITAVREDGEWVVCGGLGEEPVDDFDDDFGGVTNVSSEGVCGLVTPEELTAAGQLEYDTSSGFVLSMCSYSSSDFEMYHTATVTVELDSDAEYTATAYGANQELEVAGARAFTSPDGNTPLIVQVGPDMLNISIWPPETPPEGYDGLAQSIAIAELFVPRIPESREALVEPVPPPLCDLTFAADFEAATGLFVNSGSVDGQYCNFESRDNAYLNASVSEGTVEQYQQFYPDAEELTVAGMPALQVDDESTESRFAVYVELPGEQLLTVSVESYAYDKPLELPGLEVSELLTQHILDRQAQE